ncbi:MAG: amidohydrolase family protein [Thermodesulfobacteriota bacterium]
MEFDLVIADGTIVDGRGRPAFQGHVAVKDGRIVEVAEAESNGLDQWYAETVVEAEGLVVAPGFIDLHSHADFILPLADHPELLACFLEQGVTTVVAGNCGFSPAPAAVGTPYRGILADVIMFISAGRRLPDRWDTLDSFLADLEKSGVVLNLAQLAGHGSMRATLFGPDYSYPGEAGLAPLERMIQESLDAGAFGLSFGLGYAPGMFVDGRELLRLADLVSRRDGLLTVHLKALSHISPAYGLSLGGEPHNLRALREMLDLAEKTGVRLQISHLIFVGRKTWPTCDRALEMIEAARERGVDVAFDSFPQTAGNTTIYVVYPDWFLKDIEKNFQRALARLRLKLEWMIGFWLVGFGLEDAQLMWAGGTEYSDCEGRFFPDIGQRLGCSTTAAYLKISQASQGRATCLFHKYSGDENNESVLRKVLTHPLNTFETDAIVHPEGLANPGAYGTFPRIIQRYVRELGLMSLELAVSKMTWRSAQRAGLKDRGAVAPGFWADLTLFDYKEIKDNTTIYDSRERPAGIKHVFMNGVQVVRDGLALPGLKAGRVLRK